MSRIKLFEEHSDPISKYFVEPQKNIGEKLKKISNGVYYIGGVIKSSSNIYIDLDMMFNDKNDEHWKEYWKERTFTEFVPFGLPEIKIWDSIIFKNYLGENSLLNSMCHYETSSDIVKPLVVIFHEILKNDKKSPISELYWGRSGGISSIYEEKLLFEIKYYSSGYSVYVYLPLNKFLDLDFNVFRQSEIMTYQLNTYIHVGYLNNYMSTVNKLTESQKEGSIKKFKSRLSFKKFRF